MPEPSNETGFVPGSGIETVADSVSNSEPTVLDIGRDFTDALMGRITTPDPQEEVVTEEGDGESTDPVSQDGAEAQTQTPREEAEPADQTPPGDGRLVVSQEELDRLVQGETDRRESVRKNREQRELQRTQNKRKLDNLRQSGDLEGFAAEYAAQEAEEAQTEALTAQRNEHIREVAVNFDTGVLDPIILRLPKDEIQQLVSTLNPVGIDGRAAFLSAAVDRLVEKAKAEGAAQAERSLRNNSAFKKQLLLQERETEEEPENIPARAGSTSGQVDMNAWMDRLLHRG